MFKSNRIAELGVCFHYGNQVHPCTEYFSGMKVYLDVY